MKIEQTEFKKALEKINAAKKIAVISHKSPDGDTLGANLGLRLALEHQLNKEVVSACIDTPPPTMDFLPEIKSFAADFDQSAVDLIITVDISADYMTGYLKDKPDLLKPAEKVINIDHHASNTFFGAINLVDPEAASATQIIYCFLQYAGLKTDRRIATCLLNGLYFDTGSFMHSNSTPEVLRIASDLVLKGGDFKTIAKRQFHTMSVPQLKLFGRIFERINVNSRRLTVSAVTKKDFEETGAGTMDTTGAVDYLNSVPDGNFCCLLYEDRKGTIKGSFRTRSDDMDLSKLAGMFGGGGHEKASGFSFPGSLQEISPRIKIVKDHG